MLYTFFFPIHLDSGISLVLLKTICSVKIKIYLFCLSSGLLTVSSYCYPAFRNLCIMSEMQAGCCGDCKSNEPLGILVLWFIDFVSSYSEWLIGKIIFFAVNMLSFSTSVCAFGVHWKCICFTWLSFFQSSENFKKQKLSQVCPFTFSFL